MRLYEYLIGGKKTGQIDDLKDPMPEGKPFCDLKTGETFFVSHFGLDGTCAHAMEIKITSIDKGSGGRAFTGFTKEGENHTYYMWAKDLDKKLEVWDQRIYYKVFSTFEIDDESFFELVKKEIKN